MNYLNGYNSTFSPSPEITKKNVFLPLCSVTRPIKKAPSLPHKSSEMRKLSLSCFIRFSNDFSGNSKITITFMKHARGFDKIFHGVTKSPKIVASGFLFSGHTLNGPVDDMIKH